MTLLQDGSDLTRDSAYEGEIAPFAPGYLLADRWKIIERIGKGGFGFVYSAEDTELETTVAIKVLRPEHETSAQTIARFKQEIQLARQVTHKNVCRIYDVGFHEQGKLRLPFLSMELLDGEPLDQRLQDVGPIPIEEVEVIAMQVAAALDAAHSVGIVHADLKPANIMVVGQGASTRAVVADFGLAFAHGSRGQGSDESKIVGTPAYMAPEQVEGKTLTPAADFYALGCTLYHLISGQLPFHADTPVTTARARLAGPPPSLGDAAKTIPPRWVALVKDLMTIDPEARVASAQELRKRLRKPRRARYIALSLVALLLIASVGLNLFSREESKAANEPFVLSVPEDPEALALYERGLEQWKQFNLPGAIETWQGAIDAGHRHPRLYMRLCDGLSAIYATQRKAACTDDAFKASRSLGPHERLYYDAYHALNKGEAIDAADGLSQLLKLYPGNFEIVRLLASLKVRNREYTGAIETLATANIETPIQEVRLRTAECAIRIFQMQYEEVIVLANEILPRARALSMRREELLILDALAQAHRNLGYLDKTEMYAKEAHDSAEALGFTRVQALALSHLSAVAIKRGEFTRASELLEGRQALLADTNDKLAVHQLALTHAENMAATGRPREAYALLTNDTIPRMRRDNNTYWEGYGKIVRAEIQRSLGNFDAAIEDCGSGESLFRTLKNYRLQSFAQVVCAETMLHAGRFDEARDLLAKARATRTKLNLQLILLQNSLLDAELLLVEGKAADANTIARSVAATYKKKELYNDEVVALDLVARSALAMGEVQEAMLAAEKAVAHGAGEHIELDIAIRFTHLLAQRAGQATESATSDLEALRSEATALGYQNVANRIAAALKSP